MKRILNLDEVETRAGRWVTVGDQITIGTRKMRVTVIDTTARLITLED